MSRFCFLFVLFAVGFCCSAKGNSLTLGSLKDWETNLRRIKADSWSVVGKNIIVQGNVYIPYGDMKLYADRAVVNIESHDVEAAGNIRLLRWVKTPTIVSPGQLAALEKTPHMIVTVTGISGDIWGVQSINTSVMALNDTFLAERLSGNLKSGYFRFDNVQLKFKNMIARAESGERRPDGVIEIQNAQMSACNYLQHDNAHYSVGAASVRLTPHATEFYGLEDMERDRGEYTVLLFNGLARIYGVPVMWLPMFYKPKDQSPGLFSMQWGKNNDWGYYLNLSKKFTFSEYPLSSVKVLADIYEKRGFGYGISGEFLTENSRTELFAYSIYDNRPYETDDYEKYRLNVPHGRYDFRLSNVSHITPRLDFRGVAEYMSDAYMTRDFFANRYNAMPQPATYLALEQQFDHLSASVYFRPQLVNFFTTVERLPELQLNAQRQQIFDTPVYYQGDMSAAYLRMNWLKFDDPPLRHLPDDKLKNYESFRFDTTHFLYLPFRHEYFTLVPRAGFKVTGYSNSSKTKVTDDDLLKMFAAADPEGTAVYSLKNYDKKGGSRTRFAGELGAELSTKIHNTWQNVRNSWLQLDGLRHIMRPYMNYTYIGTPTENREHLYYFDDIDRISRQSFFRFGLENRLQTRVGNRIQEYLRLENYIDVHTFKEDGLSNIGDLCTILSMSPFKGLVFSSQLQIDAGGNNERLPEVVRNGRPGGHPGIDIKWINRWNMSVSYSPIDDFSFNFSYDYMRPYASRSAYSMGSSLTSIEGGRWFNRTYFDYSETLSFGFKMPLTPDRRTFGSFSVSYDFEAGHVSTYDFSIRRVFHCWELLATLVWEYDRDDGWEPAFAVQAVLTGLNDPLMKGQNEVLSSAGSAMRQQQSEHRFF